MKNRDFSNAKIEHEVSQKLAESFDCREAGMVLAPIGGSHLDRIGDGYREEIQCLVRQGVAGAINAPVRQSASTYSDANLGLLLGPTAHAGEIIDLLRSKEIFSRAGAREISLPVNGTLQMTRVTEEMEAFWVGERRPTPSTEASLGALIMKARKMAAITTFDEELLKFGGAATEVFVRNELVKALVKKLDLTMLLGAGTEVEPRGLLNTDGVVKMAASGVGTNGDTLEPQDIALLLALIGEGDVDLEGASVVMRPLTKAGISTARVDAVAAGDKRGPLLFPYDASGPVAKLSGATVIESSRVPKNRVKGTGSNLTMAIAGDFSEAVIGRAGVIGLSLNTQSDTNFAQGLISLKAVQFVDFTFRHPQAFGYIDQLLPTVVAS